MSSELLIPDEWSSLLNGLADGVLTTSQEQRLASLLRDSGAFRQEYVRFCQLTAQLGWQATDRSPRQAWSPPAKLKTNELRTHRRNRRRILVSIAAATLIAAACWFGLRAVPNDTLGFISQASGRVSVFRAGTSEAHVIGLKFTSASEPVRVGDRLQTDRFGTALVELNDHSRLSIEPGSNCEFGVDRGVSVSMPTGRLAARVAPQRKGESLSILTSHARVGVLGTELEVLARNDQSEVAVLEGRVSVTRQSDDARIDVGAMEFARVSGREFAAFPIPDADHEWQEDFEDKLAVAWTGRRFRQAVHGRSAGMIGSVAVDGPQGVLQVASSPRLAEGLFEWHSDSVLHITYRIQPPEWFHIDLLARPYGDSTAVLTYCHVNPDLWRTSPGEWRTVSIPLSSFVLLSPAGDDAGLGRIPTQISFIGGGPTGIEIDRVWVDRTPQP
jgi:ferric-dicitrate binding protein FerR (iron transport regulator)